VNVARLIGYQDVQASERFRRPIHCAFAVGSGAYIRSDWHDTHAKFTAKPGRDLFNVRASRIDTKLHTLSGKSLRSSQTKTPARPTDERDLTLEF
jgi:hypothetical protein